MRTGPPLTWSQPRPTCSRNWPRAAVHIAGPPTRSLGCTRVTAATKWSYSRLCTQLGMRSGSLKHSKYQDRTSSSP